MTQLDDASGGRPMRPGLRRLATALPWVLAGGLATALTLVALAPAAWIAPQFARATGGHVNLVDPDGSLWHGSGTLMLAPGADQSAATLLPGRVEWTTRFWPLLTGRVQMRMRQTEAMPDAVTLDATWRGAVLSAGTMTVPASLLAGLGTPFNTLDLQGDVRLGWSDWRLIGNNAFGQLTVTIDSMSSRVSRVKPLGSYRAVLQAKGPAPISTCRRRKARCSSMATAPSARARARSAAPRTRRPSSRRTSRGC